MNASTAYIAIAIAALGVIAVLLVFVARRGRAGGRLTPLAGLAFAFVVAGVTFGDRRLLGYGLMAFGVVLAVVDIIVRSRRKQLE